MVEEVVLLMNRVLSITVITGRMGSTEGIVFRVGIDCKFRTGSDGMIPEVEGIMDRVGVVLVV